MLPAALDKLLAEARADARFAKGAPGVTEAIELLDEGANESGDLLGILDAFNWIAQQPRSLEQRLRALGKLVSHIKAAEQRREPINISSVRKFLGW